MTYGEESREMYDVLLPCCPRDASRVQHDTVSEIFDKTTKRQTEGAIDIGSIFFRRSRQTPHPLPNKKKRPEGRSLLYFTPLLLQEAGLQYNATTINFAVYLLGIVCETDALNLRTTLDDHR